MAPIAKAHDCSPARISLASDGIVPYWSSRLDCAKSELIVHSGHGAQYDPEAIREVGRILKENLTASR
jgi:hypothetical protein